MDKNVVQQYSPPSRVAIIGAGPAGLTAAYILSKAGVPVVVFEADPSYVGGISRTVKYKGFRFDIGGHRFFSKSKAVEDLWDEILPDDIITRPRSSRLLYGGKFYDYPLQAIEVLRNLGIFQSALCFASYCKVKVQFNLGMIASPVNFEEWVVYNFGWRLYLAFFKTYTEKVWGIPCSQISADWAVQRIKSLSLLSAAKNTIRALLVPVPKNRGAKQIKTLIKSFRYPRLGPGMMWESAKAKVLAQQGQVLHGACVTSLNRDEDSNGWYLSVKSGTASVAGDGCGNDPTQTHGPFEHVISSAPIAEILKAIEVPLPKAALEAAAQLKYRDFILVALILEEEISFEDQWIYIHDPDCKVGRIQNFKNWSPELLDGSGNICLGMEYFCNRGDEIWSQTDESLSQLAVRELAQLGLGSVESVVDSCVVRQAKAYPVYDDNYKENLEVIRNALGSHCPGLHQVGRNGLHKYNNQDHSMMTAMLVARNLLDPSSNFDPWCVNQDAEYIEEG